MRPGGIQRQVSIPTNLGNSGINNSRIKRSGIKPKDLAPTPHDGRSLDKPLKQAPQVKRQLSDLDGPGTLRLDLSTRRTVEVPPPEQQGGERRSVQWQRELELLPGTLKQGRGGLQDDPVGDLRQSLTGKRTLEAPLESKETLRQIGEPRQSLESKQTHEGPVEPKGRGLPPQPKKGGNLSGKQKSPVKDFDFYDYYKKKEVEKYEPFVSGELSPSAHIKRFDKEHHSRYRDYYDMEGKYRVFYHLQADPDCCFYLFSKPGKKEMERLSKYRDEVMAAALANVYHSHINALEYLYEHKRLNEERDDVNFFLRVFNYQVFGLDHDAARVLIVDTLKRAGKAWLRMHEKRVEEKLRQLKIENMIQERFEEQKQPDYSQQPGFEKIDLQDHRSMSSEPLLLREPELDDRKDDD